MNRLERLHRRSLYVTGGVLLATGVAWAALHYLPSWFGVGERSARAINSILMKVHGAAAMAGLVLLGTLLPEHVVNGWNSLRNRVSGIAIAATCLLLIITGYLLYYAGSDDLRGVASWLHVALGALLPAVAGPHAWRLARLRARRRKRHAAHLRMETSP